VGARQEIEVPADPGGAIEQPEKGAVGVPGREGDQDRGAALVGAEEVDAAARPGAWCGFQDAQSRLEEAGIPEQEVLQTARTSAGTCGGAGSNRSPRRSLRTAVDRTPPPGPGSVARRLGRCPITGIPVRRSWLCG
jgi:hypothetical protein